MLQPQANVIWKYVLPDKDEFDLMLPPGACPLSVGAQGEEIVLWVAVDGRAEERVPRRFLIVSTGQLFPSVPRLRFIGTVQQSPLGFVCHLFESSLGREEKPDDGQE